MAETMIERVALAIAGEIDCVDWTAPDNTMSHAERLNAIALDAARVAIEAMAEPTEEMVDAGAVAEGDGNLEAEARNLWAVMISAALRDSGTPGPQRAYVHNPA